MEKGTFIIRGYWRLILIGCLAPLQATLSAQPQASTIDLPGYTVAMVKGSVEVARAGTQLYLPVLTNTFLRVGDRVRVGPRSQFAIRQEDKAIYRFDQNTEFQIQPPRTPTSSKSRFNLISGILYFFHRDKPTELEIESRTASAAVRGTEFSVQVTDGAMIVTVIDGRVELSNALGARLVENGQEGVAADGQPPTVRPAIDTLNIIQWTLFYPGVLDLRELSLSPAERAVLNPSLTNYSSGDLLRALAEYPAERIAQSDAERVYHAALLLSVGRVDAAQTLLASVPHAATGEPSRSARLASALEQVIAAVKGRAGPPPYTPELATEWLAESYRLQASIRLEEALNAARRAAASSAEFGFAWARVAELEFGFGRIDPASAALDKAMRFSPRNAQAAALNGFFHAARNRIRAAIPEFERALALDGGLANAWLGRGLSRIRLGHAQAGREDLLTAAALEPQRALLRSYLGKAWSDAGERNRAEHELNLAKQLDPRDPTAWLYSALLNQQENRINEGIRDLEKSQGLNENRSVYRSRLLLDQDRAVRSANLAKLFSDDNMTDVSLREAASAVNADYANYSAHLFLANSYDQLRDPNFVNLRLETAANSEYLIANLLAPVGGGILNSAISQQEYSKLFEENRLGIVSSTEYLSRGAWIEHGAQYGIFDTTSYSLSAFYRTDPGQRSNNDVEQRQLVLQVKQQLTAKDTVYVEASHLEIEAGDLAQYYDNVSSSPGLRSKETQEPILTLGYHREWSPGQHTLLLASWLNDDFRYRSPRFDSTLLVSGQGILQAASGLDMGTRFRNRAEVFSIEPQHIWQGDRNVAIIGGRYQAGELRMENLQSDPIGPALFFGEPAASQDLTADIDRFSVYAYDQYKVVRSLWLTAGIAYDRITFPQNLFAPPFSDRETTEDQLSPKAGLIWKAPTGTTVRFAYGRSLSGATLEQSVRIEPTQVAGFNQAFRGLIPESVTGSIPGADMETYGLSVEQKIGSGTYFGISGWIGDSDVTRTIGAFAASQPPPPEPGQPIPPPRPATATSLAQSLDYGEKSARFTIDQLLGDTWALGARYQIAYVDLRSAFPEVSESVYTTDFFSRQSLESVLHQVSLVGTFNHPSGAFGQFEADWYSQSNRGYAPARTSDAFWQLNLFAGWRFFQRRAELRIGLLNLTDTDYHLDPLTFYSDLPRERTWTARFRFNF